ncbi:MAG: ABC transporter ATP-binding protein [Lachnospiraceae bacterium]|nr:ABC transporter ATP-binding protein [Lachnospiraceae bacterium]
MLEIKGVNKNFHKNKVLEDINIHIQKGEIHGLIGENSAGKTTLIKCIMGIYKTDGGEILLDEAPVYDNPMAKEKLGYVADVNEYIRCYSVKGIVKLFKDFYDDFSVERFYLLNQTFKLDDKKLISNLSKGQKMRLAFMLSLAQNPDYLILDEPTSGLDVMGKKELFDILVSEVEEKNIGVLISSHNLEGLERICDTVTLLKKGRVIMQNTLDDVKNTYTKWQAVFEKGIPKELRKHKQVIEISSVGSIYTIVTKHGEKDFEAYLKGQGASLVEEIPISLEELFVYSSKEGDV